MEIQKSVAAFEAEIRPYYPSIPDADMRAATDDLIAYADKKEKEGVRSGQLKPRPDGEEFDKIREKFTAQVLNDFGGISNDLKQLIEDLLAYASQLANIVDEN